MTDIAVHIRIFEANPSDDFVQKRQLAIADISALLQKRGPITEILQLANDLAGAILAKGKLSPTLASHVESAIKKQSPSFVQEGQELQLIACALLGALSYLEGAQSSGQVLSRTDALAFGLWSALSFQKPRSEPKLEALRLELLKRAETLTLQTAESGRTRLAVPEATFSPPEGEGIPGVDKHWKSGPAKTIQALRYNAALDREEIDLLWWVLSDWSELFGSRYSVMDSDLGALAAAIEASKILKKIPAEAHKHLVLRHVTKQKTQSLGDLVKGLGDNRLALTKAWSGDATLSSCPHVFPLLTSISSAQAPNSNKDQKTTVDWGARALLESGILRITTLPNSIS